MRSNCPNCGATIEPYKSKCKFCGSWYFDLTAFDMIENKPCYVKIRTPQGIITTRAIPELKDIEVTEELIYDGNYLEAYVNEFIKTRNCDIGIIFHALADPENNILYTWEED